MQYLFKSPALTLNIYKNNLAVLPVSLFFISNFTAQLENSNLRTLSSIFVWLDDVDKSRKTNWKQHVNKADKNKVRCRFRIAFFSFVFNLMHSSHQHHHCNKLSVSFAILITFQTFLSLYFCKSWSLCYCAFLCFLGKTLSK